MTPSEVGQVVPSESAVPSDEHKPPSVPGVRPADLPAGQDISETTDVSKPLHTDVALGKVMSPTEAGQVVAPSVDREPSVPGLRSADLPAGQIFSDTTDISKPFQTDTKLGKVLSLTQTRHVASGEKAAPSDDHEASVLSDLPAGQDISETADVSKPLPTDLQLGKAMSPTKSGQAALEKDAAPSDTRKPSVPDVCLADLPAGQVFSETTDVSKPLQPSTQLGKAMSPTEKATSGGVVSTQKIRTADELSNKRQDSEAVISGGLGEVAGPDDAALPGGVSATQRVGVPGEISAEMVDGQPVICGEPGRSEAFGEVSGPHDAAVSGGVPATQKVRFPGKLSAEIVDGKPIVPGDTSEFDLGDKPTDKAAPGVQPADLPAGQVFSETADVSKPIKTGIELGKAMSQTRAGEVTAPGVPSADRKPSIPGDKPADPATEQVIGDITNLRKPLQPVASFGKDMSPTEAGQLAVAESTVTSLDQKPTLPGVKPADLPAGQVFSATTDVSKPFKTDAQLGKAMSPPTAVHVASGERVAPSDDRKPSVPGVRPAEISAGQDISEATYVSKPQKTDAQLGKAMSPSEAMQVAPGERVAPSDDRKPSVPGVRPAEIPAGQDISETTDVSKPLETELTFGKPITQTQAGEVAIEGAFPAPGDTTVIAEGGTADEVRAPEDVRKVSGVRPVDLPVGQVFGEPTDISKPLKTDAVLGKVMSPSEIAKDKVATSREVLRDDRKPGVPRAPSELGSGEKPLEYVAPGARPADLPTGKVLDDLTNVSQQLIADSTIGKTMSPTKAEPGTVPGVVPPPKEDRKPSAPGIKPADLPAGQVFGEAVDTTKQLKTQTLMGKPLSPTEAASIDNKVKEELVAGTWSDLGEKPQEGVKSEYRPADVRPGQVFGETVVSSKPVKMDATVGKAMSPSKAKPGDLDEMKDAVPTEVGEKPRTTLADLPAGQTFRESADLDKQLRADSNTGKPHSPAEHATGVTETIEEIAPKDVTKLEKIAKPSPSLEVAQKVSTKEEDVVDSGREADVTKQGAAAMKPGITFGAEDLQKQQDIAFNLDKGLGSSKEAPSKVCPYPTGCHPTPSPILQAFVHCNAQTNKILTCCLRR
jgi:hypothetical protein